MRQPEALVVKPPIFSGLQRFRGQRFDAVVGGHGCAFADAVVGNLWRCSGTDCCGDLFPLTALAGCDDMAELGQMSPNRTHSTSTISLITGRRWHSRAVLGYFSLSFRADRAGPPRARRVALPLSLTEIGTCARVIEFCNVRMSRDRAPTNFAASRSISTYSLSSSSSLLGRLAVCLRQCCTADSRPECAGKLFLPRASASALLFWRLDL